MTENEALNKIEGIAHRELGADAESLGVVWGLYVQAAPPTTDRYKRRSFTVTYRNGSGEKRTYGYDAATGNIY